MIHVREWAAHAAHAAGENLEAGLSLGLGPGIGADVAVKAGNTDDVAGARAGAGAGAAAVAETETVVIGIDATGIETGVAVQIDTTAGTHAVQVEA